MSAWENRVAESSDLADVLCQANDLGREGWEVVFVFTHFRPRGMMVVAWLRRALPMATAGTRSGGRQPNAEKLVLEAMESDSRENTAMLLSRRTGLRDSSIYKIMHRLRLRKKVAEVRVELDEGLGEKRAWKLL